MSSARPHGRRRHREPRGTVLIVCLMLMLVASFLAGLALLLARTENTMSATQRGGAQALTAAEYGLELSVNSLDPGRPATPFVPQTLGPGVRTTPGLRDGSNAAAVNQGPTACPPGYSLSLGCSAYSFAATGWARAWLATTASTQLEAAEAIFRGCNGTEFSC